MSHTSVIMVSFHTGAVLPVAVTSVLSQEGLAELVLVDNGNPPDMLARLQQMALSDARLKIISGQGNIGFAAGCNLGAKQAVGDYLLLLNPDCLLPPNALLVLMREMNALPNTMLAGVHIVNPDGSEQRSARRVLLTPKTALRHAFGMGKKPSAMLAETHDVSAISGACMCIRKSDFEALGGLDEGYFLHVEDMDLCMRVSRAGKRIVCVPAVKIAHLLSTSGNTRGEFIERHKAKGFIRYFEKHFSEEAFFGVMHTLRAGVWMRYYMRKTFSGKRSSNIAASRKLMILASSLVSSSSVPAITGKTVVVTGATSQVGVYVVKHLLASGAAVLAVSRDEPLPFEHPHLKWLKGDIARDDFSLGGFLADVAIHSAPLWFLPKILPLLATSDVRRVVAVGSTSIFTKASSRNAFEKDVVVKYTRTEQDIAAISAVQKMAWTIVRPTLVYGAGLDKNISSVAACVKRFGFFPVYPPAVGRRQPVHAEDVALATLQAAVTEQAHNKGYNISGGEVLTYRAMIERVFVALGQPVRIIETTLLPSVFALAGVLLRRHYLTRDVATRMNEDLIFFHDDAVQDFGYAPRVFLSGGTGDL